MKPDKFFYVGVKALIVDGGKVLLLKANTISHEPRLDPYWDLAGGKIKTGEAELQTLARETEEETGCHPVGQTQLFETVISNHEKALPDGELAGLVLRIWQTTIDAPQDVRIGNEHLEFAWFAPTEAAELLANKYPADFCEKIRRLE